jgi:hypothetical protein
MILLSFFTIMFRHSLGYDMVYDWIYCLVFIPFLCVILFETISSVIITNNLNHE